MAKKKSQKSLKITSTPRVVVVVVVVIISANAKASQEIHLHKEAQSIVVLQDIDGLGRFEAHLWDKNCWNESQSKKGRQVYLGAYDDEEAAARAYDLAALKYWGQHTILNFPVSNYEEELKEMEGQTKRRIYWIIKKKKAVDSLEESPNTEEWQDTTTMEDGKLELAESFGNKYLYLGTYATQEEAATAYDMAAIEYRGLNAVTNFDLSRYLHPKSQDDNNLHQNQNQNQNPSNEDINLNPELDEAECVTHDTCPESSDATSAASSTLGLFFKTSKFKEMLENTSSSTTTPPVESNTPPLPTRTFPEDIQTIFETQDSGIYTENDDDVIFGDWSSFTAPIFHYELDA